MACCSSSSSTLLGALVAAAAGIAIVNFSGAGIFGSCGSSSQASTEVGAEIVASADASSCCPLGEVKGDEALASEDSESAVQQVSMILGSTPNEIAKESESCAEACADMSAEDCEKECEDKAECVDKAECETDADADAEGEVVGSCCESKADEATAVASDG